MRRPSLRQPAFLLLVALAPATALAGGGGSEVISNIAIAMVAASLLGFLMKLFRQPLLLGYILGGVVVGPLGMGLVSDRESITEISQIGLILLLFMIGLEIDLKKMMSAGRAVVIPGALQFPLCFGAGWALFWLLGAAGFPIGSGSYAAMYLAVAISISSTMIVVKLLYDKLELDTVAGRITVGILVFQDIWAIIVLAVQPNLTNPEVLPLLRTFAAGALLVGAALLASRYVLPRIFHVVAKVPELMVVLSLGWCFAVGLVAALPAVGLSMEMGALIAGVSLATFPYSLDVNARVLNIRDFFITLFFVSLGMQITAPTPGLVGLALIISAALVVTRFVGVFGILKALGTGHGTSLLATINLSQMSEFSLVILSIGVAFGHIGPEVLAIGLWTFAISAVLSTYQIQWSQPLQRALSALLVRIGVRDLPPASADSKSQGARGIVMLGYFRIARSFVEDIARRDQHLVEQLKVVDFNPEVRKQLDPLGIPVIYGDISNLDTLHHADIEHADVVLCTIPNTFLRGTTNARLLQTLRPLCPDAKIIVTAETPEQAVELYQGGAHFVLQPSVLAGSALIVAVEQALRGTSEAMREDAEADLAERTGPHPVLPAS